ncbi:hypothetical protein THMIRHAS_09670 [Thiosulfatimonas sediminis]|uniref:DUF697 domain-containing protein n=1 Tax=Thiosulfatimonas sediminis TaxID=2675054 RepID=A0A6F8PUA0_9GAMM|nr:DUF697 domain-containing protein [Thiosulfatimonas sediminis]BBP45594.1 hypothetical protein THMIRHAS_09670 [Thiosulfatimonas sediminis]
MQQPNYQERVKKRKLQQSQPQIAVPSEAFTEVNAPLVEERAASGWLLLTLMMALLTFISFSLVQSYLYILSLWLEHPFFAGFLAILLLLLVVALVGLISREWRGLRSIDSLTATRLSVEALSTKGDKQSTLNVLQQRKRQQSASAFARTCYHAFEQSLRAHHSNQEVLKIYHDQVSARMLEQAKIALKSESITAGGISLLSPNSLLQTLGLLWVSLRTLRKIALVYGVRPGLLGNFKLLRIALENLAASSLVDLLTDEFANQLGGSLADKVLANSVDAITAASLNQRLGKALIAELSKSHA